ncbi:MAG: hypothetical protein QNI99_02405 [Woeseiaceae bacterium]|nr:hypothetical protein [Woeseiaceae bacterium]
MNKKNSLAVVLCLMLLGACSDADREEPEELPDSAYSDDEAESTPELPVPGLQVADAGVEPRVALRIEGSLATEIEVSASSRSEGTIGGEPLDDSLFASYLLNVDLIESEPGRLLARFSVADIATTPSIGFDDPGTWEWRLDENGMLLSSTPPALPPGNRLSEVLSTVGLVLMVPPEPIGEGAAWTYTAPGSDTPIEFGVTGISDDEIDGFISSRHETAGGTISILSTGSWDRRSLLATRGVSQIQMEIESTTTRNGEEVPVSITRAVRFLYGADE